MKSKNNKINRKIRTRSKFKGTRERPRLSVYRSNKFIYAQLINDEKGETILGLSEEKIKDKKETKSQKAKRLGIRIAKLAMSKKIENVVFDRGNYAYHGRVEQVAQGAREGGLKF